MKNILLLTDFTKTAENAVRYGYHLSVKLQANILLCNVMNIPAEIPQFEVPVLPLSGYDHMIDESENSLKEIREKLELIVCKESFRPAITCLEQVGRVTDTVLKLVRQHKIDLVIVGTHSNKGLVEWALGNHVANLIDVAKVPIFIVPNVTSYQGIHKIALTLNDQNRDLSTLNFVSEFAEKLDAELFLFHIAETQKDNYEKVIDANLLSRIKKTTNLIQITAKPALKGPLEKQLTSLCESEGIDLLVMIHRHRSFISDIIFGSHSRKMARQTNVPVLIIPEKNQHH